VLVSLQLSANVNSLPKGVSQQYTATGIFSDNSQQNLTGSVSWNTANHAVATVDGTGFLTAADVGTTNVTADLSGVHGQVSIDVTMAILTGVSVSSPDTVVASGSTEQYTATGTYSDFSTADLTTQATWTSSDPVVSIGFNTGLAQALLIGNASSGHADITATYGGMHDTRGLDVSPAALVSITVGSSTLAIPNGTTLQFSAIGHYTDFSSQNLTNSVTWTSSGPQVSVDTVTGLATAVSVGGPVSIQAASGMINASRPLTVTAAVPTGLTVSPLSTTIAVGTKRQFVATASYSDGVPHNVTSQATWQSSATGVATIVTATGLATAVSPGTTNITASFAGFTNSGSLSVNIATLASIAITPATPSMPVGFDVAFRATGTYTDSSTQDLTTQVTWASSAPTIATIDTTHSAASGTTTTLLAGTTTISATLGSRVGSTVFTVTPYALAALTVTPAGQHIATCDCEQLIVTGSFPGGAQTDYDVSNSVNISLASSNDNTVRVYQSGSGQAQVWLACSDSSTGTATITASHFGDSITGTTTAINDGVCN
jgi:hypothetical protein